ncbi:hypothetical protein Tsubulata_036397 [Turnera subulata]|uniref:Uncharacterized protein n=1 Tax=Turnera subulata TaxID=218843 RepID=A0A9Q0JIG7_9ROSI|nr:hypothetical protein Tsubulata_036397 [Turnera subulata]
MLALKLKKPEKKRKVKTFNKLTGSIMSIGTLNDSDIRKVNRRLVVEEPDVVVQNFSLPDFDAEAELTLQVGSTIGWDQQDANEELRLAYLKEEKKKHHTTLSHHHSRRHPSPDASHRHLQGRRAAAAATEAARYLTNQLRRTTSDPPCTTAASAVADLTPLSRTSTTQPSSFPTLLPLLLG